MGMKIFLVAEANEKPPSVYHPLKLHPYGPDAERQKENDEPIVSSNYDEITFNEPAEAFYEILTSPGPVVGKAKATGKGSKQAMMKRNQERSAEIPQLESKGNPYSVRTEGQELDRLKDAFKQVEVLLDEEKQKLAEREAMLAELRKTEGTLLKTRS